ncbi:armadillo-type protein [Zopfochytrium polystomum]|nr:armadillo-type protein [Zopfochytrium polystomum]
MDASTLKIIEDAAWTVYGPLSAQEKELAERTLSFHFPTFSESTFATVSNSSPTTPMTPLDTIANCQFVLEQSSSPYAQLFVTTHLKLLVFSHFSLISLQQKLELRNFVLNILGRRTDLTNYVSTALAELFGHITKLGWFDGEEFQNSLVDVSNFLNATPEHRYAGIQLLACLVYEMNRQTGAIKNITRHRKTAVHFRDNQLGQIFQLSIDLFRQLVNRQTEFSNASVQSRTHEVTVLLMKNCLQFDFIGTNPDDSAEDVGSIQFPLSWKPIVTDISTLQIVYDAYKSFPEALTPQVLECLTILVSARRTLYSDEERPRMIAWVLHVTSELMRKFLAQDSYPQKDVHEFCKLLVRLKGVTQLADLVSSASFGEWVDLLAVFTMKNFTPSWWASNTVVYLMTFWSKIILNMPTPPRADSYIRIEHIAMEICNAFVSQRVDVIGHEDDDEAKTFLDIESTTVSIMEYVAVMARLRLKEVGEYVMTAFDQVASQYQELVAAAANAPPNNKVREQLDHVELKFSFITTLIGCIIGARSPAQDANAPESVDAELSARVLQLLDASGNWSTQQRQQGLDPKSSLELAFLYFFQQFRKTYIHQMDSRFGKDLYSILGEMCGMDDDKKMMNLMVQKICNNLKFMPDYEALVARSISLLSELASGHTSMRHLRKTETAHILLKYHNAHYFPFLDSPAHIKRRTMFYATISRLLFADDNIEMDVQDFLSLFTPTLDELMHINSIDIFQQPKIRTVVECLFRDLRGFVSAIELNEVKTAYSTFFEWFLPYAPILSRAVEANYDHPVANTVLRFVGEMVLNRSQRLQTDVSSPNGILLFKEASKVLRTYGQLSLGRQIDKNHKWAQKYKGYTLCFNIFKNCLGGNYVQFGVFGLYNDPVLEDTVDIFFRIILDISLEDLISLPKLATAYYTVMDIFCKDRLLKMKELDVSVARYIVLSLAEGIRSPNPSICSYACNSVEYMCSYIFQESMKNKPPQPPLVQIFAANPQFLHLLLARLLEGLFVEEPNIWSLARPMLPLILLDKEFFDFFVSKLIQGQLVPRQQVLVTAFQDLMENVQYNLNSKNKNAFITQVHTFKRSKLLLVAQSLPLTLASSIDGTAVHNHFSST